MPIKLNWGHGLTIFILLFIITMVGMVVYSFQQTNEMIDDNYYQKEIEYQTLIDARQKLNSILKDEKLILDSVNTIFFKFPKTTFESGIKGTIEMIKIDNEKLDLNIPIIVNTEGIQTLSKDKLNKGTYRTRISWTNHSDSFYYDHSFFINK